MPHPPSEPAAAPVAAAVPRSVRWIPAVFRPTFEELLPRTRVERTRRDWVVDFLLIGISIAFGIAVHHEEMTDGVALMPVHAAADLIALPIASIALLWRRRWPLRVMLLVGLLTIASPASGFAALVAAFAIAAYSAPTVALGGLAFLLAMSPVTAWLARDPGAAWWSDALFGVIITIGVGAWGMFTGTRRQLLVTLHERARRAEAEQGLRVEQARQQERSRIAREMHDVLAHRMSLLSVHAGALEFRPDAPAEDVARAAGVIRQTAHEALEELRTVIGVLRVDDLTPNANGAAAPEPPQPTLAAVPRLIASWQQAGARVELELEVDAGAVPPAVGRTAYRVVQEGLTNASKHAPATCVTVRLSGAPGDVLVVEVRNPLPVGGAAIPYPIPGTGLGLIGLRERTELAGGGFLATADAVARQFVLRATLPWSAA